jgi:hypothetical protein
MAGGTRALPARFDQFRLTRLAGSEVLRLLLAHQRSGDTSHWGPLGGVERTDFAHSAFFAF